MLNVTLKLKYINMYIEEKCFENVSIFNVIPNQNNNKK